LLTRLRPALTDVRDALGQISGLRDTPAGRVRLLMPRFAVESVLAPKLARFAREYPDILLDVTTDDSRTDIVAGGFDAGIHLGEFIARDMIAVRVSTDHQPVIVGSPSYFEAHPKPRSPRDLLQHRCINFRHGSADVYRWEFEKGRKSLSVAVNGPLVVDYVALVLRAALDGVGLAFLAQHQIESYLESGALVGVLESWCQPYPGLFLYYPSRRQQPPALAALINVLRM
jgi:DNA-binding transcriptional LysR family regulator